MTPDVLRTDRPGRKELGRVLMESGALSPGWAPTFAAVDRAGFLPDRMWPYDMASRASVTVDKQEDADSWYAAADSNVPIVTQWDDGVRPFRGPGKLSTSSSSMPATVYSLLQDLAVEDGARVLDVGTGTGETAGALAHRLGSDNVTTIEVDGTVSAAAGERLHQLGLFPEVVVGDGFEGRPGSAPYDRILATAGVREIPGAWIGQTRPGGIILAPFGTHYGNADAMIRLVADGDEAEGRFTRRVEFMKLRTHRGPKVVPGDYLSAGPLEDADRSRTPLTERQFLTGQWSDLPFVLGLRVPACRQAVADRRDDARPVWFYSLSDLSWACVMFRDGQAEAQVWQSGPRRLWDEVSGAYHWWRSQGSPDVTRFGLTVTPDGHRAWVDDPNGSWSL
ncbi:methyltransferase domain-containing protein [Streptomyces sp. NPDC006012]|uniref:methyltransferase domain-containing protein n=1 Tax=Streptomyces sp. NPDC006012 TaxID=3364739 RepID=UPI0036CCD6BA